MDALKNVIAYIGSNLPRTKWEFLIVISIMTMKRFFWITCSVVLGACAFTCLVYGVANEQDMYHQLDLANAAFDKAGSAPAEEAEKYYGEAILHFERIVNEGGIKNAKLYYNVGNAYLLKGDVGRAIVNYRRSERLDGSNREVKKNLAFARSRRLDAVELGERRRVLKTLFFWHYDFSMRGRFAAVCFSFGGLMAVFTMMLWFGRKTWFNVFAVVFAVVFLCFGFSVGVENYVGSHQVCGVVVASEVVSRQGDGMNYPASFKDPLHSGTEFEVIRQQSGWLNIELSDGSEGWVPETSAEII
ncbi:MAG: tetratricopeptide repeat protein [Planctomycetes bacterium]|nr:tetratricopeptide repeat protein [Planctomycetota bacterium]